MYVLDFFIGRLCVDYLISFPLNERCSGTTEYDFPMDYHILFEAAVYS